MTLPPRPALMFALVVAVFAAPARAQTTPAPAPPAPVGPTAAAMAAGAVPAASSPLYIVSYIEVAPSAAAKAAGILRRYASASRKEDGNTGSVALRERQRPGRFAIVESWRDPAAHDAQSAAAAKTLHDGLQPLLVAPIDRRPSSALDVAPSAADSGPAAKGVVYVLTHVDVLASGKDKAVALIRQLIAASRKEDGNLRFDALVQTSRTNHMTLVEAWRDRAARDAYVAAAATKAFRADEAALAGALYDERLYEVVR